MPQLVSGIYRNKGRLEAVNRQALDALTYPGLDEKWQKKKKVAKIDPDAERVVRIMPGSDVRTSEPRPASEVRKLLGDVAEIACDGVKYRRRYAKNSRKRNVFELCLRCGGKWFCVDELLSVGFRQCLLRPYAGLMGEDRCKVGRYRLMEKFGINCPDAVLLAYVDACKLLGIRVS